MNLDLLIRESLLKDYQSSFNADKKYIKHEKIVSFGSVAFFKENAWQQYPNYRPAKNGTRSSHPGLSLSDRFNKVAFGTSKLKGKKNSNPCNFLVETDDCEILKKTTIFLLMYSCPLRSSDIDDSKTGIASLSSNAIDKLCKVLGK